MPRDMSPEVTVTVNSTRTRVTRDRVSRIQRALRVNRRRIIREQENFANQILIIAHQGRAGEPIIPNPDYTLPECPMCQISIMELLRNGLKIKILRCGHLVCLECVNLLIVLNTPRSIECHLCHLELMCDDYLWIFDVPF